MMVNEIKSSQWPVMTGAPKGSVLGLVLFSIFIHELDEGNKCNLNKSLNDTKLGRGVAVLLEGTNSLQRDLTGWMNGLRLMV